MVIEDHTEQGPAKQLLSPSSTSSHHTAPRTPKQVKIYGPLICQIELSRLSRIPPAPRPLSASKSRHKFGTHESACENPLQHLSSGSGGHSQKDKRRQSKSPLCKPLSDSKEYLSSSSECRDSNKKEKKRPSSSLETKSNRSYTASPAKSSSSKSKSKTYIKTECEENDLVNGLLPPPAAVTKDEIAESIPKEYLKLDPMDTNVLKAEPSHNSHLQSNGALDSTSNDVTNRPLKRKRSSSSCSSPFAKEKTTKKNKSLAKIEVNSHLN